MALNYAEKYSAQIDERFKQGSITAPAINTVMNICERLLSSRKL